MGFIVTVDHDKEEVTVTLGGKVVSLFHPKGMKEGLQAHLEWSGGDYLELYAKRLIFDADFLANKLSEEGDDNKPFGHNEEDAARTTSNEDDTDKKDGTKEAGNQTTEPVSNGHGTQAVVLRDVSSKTVDPMKDAVVNVMWQGYYNTTVEDLRDRFDISKMVWEASSPDRDAWKSRLAALKLSKVPITNVVALGLGSHHAAYNGAPKDSVDAIMPFRTSFQLVVVMLIRQILGQEDELLPCVIQDIQYSKLDKEFLKSLDFTVVDDPDAFELINANTLVFHIGTFLHVAWWICAGTWPAAMITEYDWANPEGCLVGSHNPAYVVPGLQDMFEYYTVDEEFEEESFRPRGVVTIYSIEDEVSSQATTEADPTQACPNLQV